MADVHQGRGWIAADVCRKTQSQTQPDGLAWQLAWRSTQLLLDVTLEDRRIAQLSGNLLFAAYDGAEFRHGIFPNFELCSAVTVALKACLHSRSSKTNHTLARVGTRTIIAACRILLILDSFVPTCAL